MQHQVGLSNLRVESLWPCLHGGGITLLEGSSLSIVFFLFPLHKKRDNPGVGIALPACWGYPSRRDNFLFVYAM